ncbi:XdhC/CoxI family protein [Maricurvus nonylphenolicus]|uniref:XdhC family protein n=1 Tax=Maricurvus nonylphenolicus TaxID=1008307 RepID=UPI0036F3A9CD
MANHLSHVLSEWFDLKDQTEWVLGTVYDTVGSSYRKAGAMMMFSGMGHQLGLLSGGCLEADIKRHARRVMQTGESAILVYDGNDEDDISFQLGIGCGGVVRILLQPVTRENRYLDLDKLCQSLQAGHSGTYHVDLTSAVQASHNYFEFTSTPHQALAVVSEQAGREYLAIQTKPVPHLLIAGGGVDARPLARLAAEIGWQVSIWDPRPANARREFFELAHYLIRGPIEQLVEHLDAHPIDAAVVMSHSISLDVKAVNALATSSVKYFALLGPNHRRLEVLEKAGLSDLSSFQCLAGPAGLDLGGDLPETIALSILAECQAVLSGRSAQSLSLSLPLQMQSQQNQSLQHKPLQKVS